MPFAMQLIERLPPVTKARILMALLGIILLGLALILMIVLGGRYVRRLSRSKVAARPQREDDWYRKPLTPTSDPSDEDFE